MGLAFVWVGFAIFGANAAFAAEPGAAEAAASGLKQVGAGLAAGLAVIGGGLGIGRIGGSTVDAIARQPEAAGQMFLPWIIMAAMVEGAMLFAVVVGFMMT